MPDHTAADFPQLVGVTLGILMDLRADRKDIGAAEIERAAHMTLSMNRDLLAEGDLEPLRRATHQLIEEAWDDLRRHRDRLDELVRGRLR